MNANVSILYLIDVVDLYGTTEEFHKQKFELKWVETREENHFKIVNTPTPNSIQNTCVFSYLEASNTITNYLHVTPLLITCM